MDRKRRTFIWRETKTWVGFIRELMPPGVYKQVASIICKKQELFRYYDDSDPLKSIYAGFSNFDSLGERFVATFGDYFEPVRMFHGCRPRQTETYYRQGIRVLNTKEANEQFIGLCRENGKHSNISEEDIRAAIESMSDSYGRLGQVYVGLDDRFLIKHCGHYLIYGSEYLQSLCSHLRGRTNHDLTPRLKHVGIPTMFQASIPVSQFTSQELGALADAAFPAWAYCIAHRKREPGLIDFAITLDHDLPPSSIVTHYHPEEIPDPFCGGLVYRYKHGASGISV
jgi:hypothetical protein